MRQLICSGSTFERDIAYSRAVVDGDWIFVSGTTGFNYQTMTIAEGLLEQTEQCLSNIAEALKRANSSMDDVVRVRCRATRLEMRIRPNGGGRRPIVHYTCMMPDGRSLSGRAPEVLLPAEVGQTLVIPSARGRLGVWLRVGPPEPFPETN